MNIVHVNATKAFNAGNMLTVITFPVAFAAVHLLKLGGLIDIDSNVKYHLFR